MEIDKPWREPGYTGKLKSTVPVCLPTHIQHRVDDCIETTLDLLIREKISQENATRLLNHYDKLKKDGHYLTP